MAGAAGDDEGEMSDSEEVSSVLGLRWMGARDGAVEDALGVRNMGRMEGIGGYVSYILSASLSNGLQ